MDWDKEDDKAKAERAKKDIPYFSISLTRLAALSILTFGIYDLYWFYANWKSIKAITHEKISPGWRAWFSVFFAWQLFDQIVASAVHKGYRLRFPTRLLGVVYVAGIFTQAGLARITDSNPVYGYISIGLLILTTLALLPIQAAINYNNDQLPKELQKSHNRKVVDVVLIAIEVLVILAVFVGGISDSGNEIPPKQLTQINSARDTMNSLTAEYASCSSELTKEHDGVDTSNQTAVDDYNSRSDSCEAVRVRQNNSVDAYNALIAPYQ